MEDPRVITVTLNAAIDTTYFLDGFQLGDVNRVRHVISQAGGKGNNVARVIHRLGGPVLATGFVGGSRGQEIVRKLTAEGIPNEFCTVAGGQSRECLAIVDEGSGQVTEILEPGIQISDSDGEMDRLSKVLLAHVKAGVFVIFSGSLPGGCTPEQLRGLVQAVQDKGALVIIDTSGPALQQALGWQPFTMKPNLSEFRSLWGEGEGGNGSPTGSQPAVPSWLLSRLQEMNRVGVELPLVTLGAAGAMAMIEGSAYRVQGPAIDAVNPVGSGDAFLGGLVHGLCLGQPLIEALKLAAATGIVNAQALSAGAIDAADVLSMSEKIQVEAID